MSEFGTWIRGGKQFLPGTVAALSLAALVLVAPLPDSSAGSLTNDGAAGEFNFGAVPDLERGRTWRWRQSDSATLVEFLTPSFAEDEGLRDLAATLDVLLSPLRVRSVVTVPGVVADPTFGSSAGPSAATSPAGEATPAP